MTAIPARILGTGSALPSRCVSTRELLGALFPGGATAELEARIGIRQRHWLGPGETAAGLAASALRAALEAAQLAPGDLRRIILVTSTGGDQMIPATAHGVAGALGIDGGCDAFDVSNSCVGFLTGLDLAARSAATGIGPCGVVAVETFSRRLSPAGRRAYLVLGDAAAAAIVGPSTHPREGFLASVLDSSAALRGKMVMAHAGIDASPGQGHVRAYHDFDTPSEEIAATAIALIERATAAALGKAGLPLSDIDWVLPHQPNGEIFRLLAERLAIDDRRVVPVYPDAGSLGAASVPLSLDRLMRQHAPRPGARILLTAVGSGTAHGAIVYQTGGA
jgi:3-oxoacyl-(acyl-carrier-protein) synthase III